MSTANQINVMLLVKLAHDRLSEGEADSTVVVSIGLDAALRV